MIIYRGIRWEYRGFSHGVPAIYALVCNPPWFAEPLWAVDKYVITHDATPAELLAHAKITWKKVLAHVALYDVASYPVDDIPWEIHRIEDEEAYERALTAFEANR